MTRSESQHSRRFIIFPGGVDAPSLRPNYPSGPFVILNDRLDVDGVVTPNHRSAIEMSGVVSGANDRIWDLHRCLLPSERSFGIERMQRREYWIDSGYC
ncbi:hypothetical protein NPIL_115111 [Nephila pilipes]|uniref:Uncharacterized protein n=1 Tax=Nephila pilipes TaxID=299642 RepID=A0A8X6MBT5_NEPPI|nr:hypothetical protein NPIL_115111 [Nephila pilipes]